MDLFQLESVGFFAAIIAYFIATALYFFFFVAKKEKAGTAAFGATCAAFALHSLSLVVRGIHAGRLPFTNQYEFALCFAWGIALCFLIFVRRFQFNALGAFVAPVIFLVISYAAMQSRDVRDVMPALQSRWLAFHVSCAIISYGAFGVAFGVAMVYLFRDKLTGSAFAKNHVPEVETLDLIIYRACALGFLFLTMCMITGAIWAQRAWGSYWSWDPKETWSLITWIIYAIYLHLRLNRGWKGRRSAIFAVVGFLCVIFTYIGVNTLLSGLHSYA